MNIYTSFDKYTYSGGAARIVDSLSSVSSPPRKSRKKVNFIPPPLLRKRPFKCKCCPSKVYKIAKKITNEIVCDKCTNLIRYRAYSIRYNNQRKIEKKILKEFIGNLSIHMLYRQIALYV